MVYISSDGVVGGSRSPWKLSTLLGFFLAIFNMVFLFLKTMLQPDLTSRGTGYGSSNYRSGFSGQPPPGPPRRRFQGFSNPQDSNPPPTGSCGSGGCCR